MKNTKILIAMTLATFVLVVDTSIMNVSLSALVVEFDTTLQNIQAAITLYALVMAAFMIPGAKLADILGHKKAYILGLILYGVGSFITAISPTYIIFVIGWSIIEGLGAAILYPVINMLITSNFKGKERASAYSVLGGMAAGGAALGPIIGGLLTTYASWRYAFIAESLIVIVILFMSKALISIPVENKPKLDIWGTILNATGMGIMIFGILQAGKWGFIRPLPGSDVQIMGLSPVIFIMAIGILVYFAFFKDQVKKAANGQNLLVHMNIFKNIEFDRGLSMTFFQSIIQAGTFFVIPVFTQVFLGYNAFQSGVVLLPVSIFLFAASIIGGKLAQKIYPSKIIQYGMLSMALGALLITGGISLEASARSLMPGLSFIGIGIGLLMSQVVNVILSSVEAKETPEASGIQSTIDRLGYSVGTALIGAVMIIVLSSSLFNQVQASTVIPDSAKAEISNNAEKQVTFVSTDYIEETLSEAPQEITEEFVSINATANVKSMKVAMLVIFFIAIGGYLMSRKLEPKMLVTAE